LSQQGILERGFGLRTLAILTLLMFIGAAAFVTTRPASALGTDITIVGLDIGAAAVVTTAAPNIAIPGGVGSESANPTITGGLALQVGSPAGTLYRTPATGGIVEFVAIFTGDVTVAAPLDIVTTTVSLGGINTLAGPATLVSNNVAAVAGAVYPAGTITALGNLTPAITVLAATDEHSFTLFGQGVAGTSTIFVGAGGQVGDVTQGAGGVAASTIFVGPAASASFSAATNVTGAGAAAVAALVNPTSFDSGSPVSAATTAAGVTRGHYYHVRVLDANGARQLDTGGIVSITLTNITGGASINANGSPAAAGSASIIVGTSNEAVLLLTGGAPAAVPGFAANGVAGQHGSVAFGITTTLGTPASGTITVSVLGFASVVVTRGFVAGGNIASITISEPGTNDGFLSAGGVGTNPSQGRLITALDSAGRPAAQRSAQLTIAQTTTAALDFGVAATVALAATAAVGAPQVSTVAAGVLVELGSTGTYPLGISGNATVGAVTGAGTYTFTVTATVATVVVGTAVTTVTISGAPSTGVLTSVTDNASTVVTADPAVGINGLLTIVTTWTDAASNPVPNGSALGIVAPGAVTSLGVLTAATTSNDAGSITHTFVAGAASGIATLTFTLGTGVVQFSVEVGGTGGGVVDSLDASGELEDPLTVDALVGQQVQLTVIAMDGGVLMPNAIISFESNNASLSPSLPSTNAAGEASTFVTSNVTGMVVVTATAVTQGVGGVLIPVQGIDAVVFHVTFGSQTADLSTEAVATFIAWTFADSDSSIFENVAGLDAVWKWTGSEWVLYASDADAPSNLKTSFTLSSGDVLFIVTTAGVTVAIA